MLRGKSTTKKPEKTELKIPEANVQQPIDEKLQSDQTEATDMKLEHVEAEVKLDHVEAEVKPEDAEADVKLDHVEAEIKPAEEEPIETENYDNKKSDEKETNLFAESPKEPVTEDVFVKEIKKESESSPILSNESNLSKSEPSKRPTETTLNGGFEIKIPKLSQLETDFEWKFEEDSKTESRIQNSASGRGESSLISVRMKTMEELISSITVTAREVLGPAKNRRTVRSVVKEAKLRYDV